jgi:hypothetical protein
MILIGSRALALRAPSALQRKPLDFDFIGTREEYDQWFQANQHKIHPTEVYPEMDNTKMIVKGDVICEWDIIQPDSSNELLRQLVEGNSDSIQTSFGWIPTLDLLFTIKDSHKFKKFQFSANGFWKTAMDWHMMKRMGACIRPEYQEFHKLRMKETYNYAHPKLNVKKDDFFKDDGLEYVYEHDDLHEVVKLHERPAYTYYLKEGEQVLCDKNKFFSISEDIRLAGGIEEGLTLALERSLIPHKGIWAPDYAFRFACAKVASSITSGFFRQYCFEHLPDIINLYEKTSKNYFEKFETALAAGKVRPFSGNKY